MGMLACSLFLSEQVLLFNSKFITIKNHYRTKQSTDCLKVERGRSDMKHNKKGKNRILLLLLLAVEIN